MPRFLYPFCCLSLSLSFAADLHPESSRDLNEAPSASIPIPRFKNGRRYHQPLLEQYCSWNEKKYLSKGEEISELVGGEGWKRQKIGEFPFLRPIDFEPSLSFQFLKKAVETSLRTSKSQAFLDGKFNSTLIEALLQQRSSVPGGSKSSFINSQDFVRAREIMNSKATDVVESLNLMRLEVDGE